MKNQIKMILTVIVSITVSLVACVSPAKRDTQEGIVDLRSEFRFTVDSLNQRLVYVPVQTQNGHDTLRVCIDNQGGSLNGSPADFVLVSKFFVGTPTQPDTLVLSWMKDEYGMAYLVSCSLHKSKSRSQ
jgi:hypothetical protein